MNSVRLKPLVQSKFECSLIEKCFLTTYSFKNQMYAMHIIQKSRLGLKSLCKNSNENSCKKKKIYLNEQK